MTYTIEDARFDTEQQGKCPICFKSKEDGCKHCEDCGGVDGNHYQWCSWSTEGDS